MPSQPLILDGRPLSITAVEAVSRHAAIVQIGAEARSRIDAAAEAIRQRADGPEVIYGVNTGFGSLAGVRIEPDQLRQVQRNLIRSHAAGVGDPLPTEVVRATMGVLAASLCRGHSGVRAVVVERLVDLLNQGITPVAPSRGSVGASGDLAPLAHIGLVLIGEGEAQVDGNIVSGHDALTGAGLTPLTLEAKEGLALVNGTHLMTAMGALALADIARLCDSVLDAAAMAIDACRATHAFLDERLHRVRPQPGQTRVAAELRQRLSGSQIVKAHETDDPRVQDPYCLRAAPQVLGAAFDTIDHARTVIEHELGAVTDNPLVFPDDRSIIGGANFHGMPLAIAFDTLTIALCHIAGIAERRVNWLLTASDSENPVNVYLSPQPGLHSGLMIAQYTAAACCNEMQTLSAPASVGNIPTSAGMEDYNSMGVTAAHQLSAACVLAAHVIAIELLVMAEAMEYQRPLASGGGVERTHTTVRSVVPRLTADRPPAPDIAAIAELIRSGEFGHETQ